MTQGKSVDKQRDEALLGRRIARRADTLHILAHVLSKQAEARGDTDTVALIAHTLEHCRDGDSIKLYLMSLLDR